jgi:hypothetical protein
MRSHLLTGAVAGILGISALAGVASAAPAGLKLVGLLNGHDEVDNSGNPDNGDLGAGATWSRPSTGPTTRSASPSSRPAA